MNYIHGLHRDVFEIQGLLSDNPLYEHFIPLQKEFIVSRECDSVREKQSEMTR